MKTRIKVQIPVTIYVDVEADTYEDCVKQAMIATGPGFLPLRADHKEATWQVEDAPLEFVLGGKLVDAYELVQDRTAFGGLTSPKLKPIGISDVAAMQQVWAEE